MIIRKLDLDLLDVRTDARGVDADKVRAIASSVADVGLINPIRVREIDDGRYEIVAGVHRASAYRSLGLVEIEALVVNSGDLFAELAMIDENLCRAELGPADRAQQTARRKAIYLEIHPETAEHVAGGIGRQAAADKLSAAVPSFSAETASMTGRDERSVRRDAERGEKVCDEALDLLRGTSLDTGLYLDGLKRLSPDEQVAAVERDLARALTIAEEKARALIDAKKERRADREAELGARQQALPDKRYGVILADPEWQFATWSTDGMDRSADNHYPTSPIEAIKARDVASIAADDCVLLLWATVPMLPQALDVVAAWGFSYKSHFVWLKDVPGTGYWNRNQHELLIVATRGNVPAPAPGTQFRSALAWPVGAHSEKPPFAHEIAETHFPSLPKIELNARTRREGWDAWGLEAPDEVPAAVLPAQAGGAEPAPVSPELLAYRELVAADTHKGGHSRVTAEPLLRAAYACGPVIPTKTIAADLGAPLGSVLGWAARLELTQANRRGGPDRIGQKRETGA